MVVSFLLHLYQPPQQHSYVFNGIAEACYLPLLKALKNHKELKLTLNVPLSLLEWFEKEKLEKFVTDLKHFNSLGRVEFVGSGAYHPILTKIRTEEAERQIILNEYGLSFYLGRTSNFEGEPMLMIKDLKGFFSPEMAVNHKLGELLQTLNYEWLVVDEVSARREGSYIPRLKGTDLSVITRNRDLSLCLACARDDDPDAFLQGVRYLSDQGDNFVCVALDAETFGHHNKVGMDLFENVVQGLTRMGHNIETYSSVVDTFKNKRDVEIKEATWGASDEDMTSGNNYPKWYINSNEFHESFKHLEELFFEELSRNPLAQKSKSAVFDANLPIWNFNRLSLSEDIPVDEKNYIKAQVLYDKACNSDKYWWSSKNPEFDPMIIKRSLELFMKVFEKYEFNDKELALETKKERDKILSLLKN